MAPTSSLCQLFYFLLICFGCCCFSASEVNSQLLCLFEFLLRFCLRQLIFIYTYFQLNIIKLTLRARANSAALDAHFAWFLFALLVPSSPSYWRQIIIVVWHRFAISLFTLSSAYIPYMYANRAPNSRPGGSSFHFITWHKHCLSMSAHNCQRMFLFKRVVCADDKHTCTSTYVCVCVCYESVSAHTHSRTRT